MSVQFIDPPPELATSLKRAISQAAQNVPPEKNGALVAVVTEGGVNAAIVTRVGSDWVIQSWVGKTWKGPVSGGASVTKTW